MATASKPTQGKPHALSEAVRAAGHTQAADKLEVLHALHAPLYDEHRPLTPDEHEAQQKNSLTLKELKAVQAVEYGTWVAAEDIFAGSATAYREGQPVPVSNVEQHGYDQLGVVRRVNPEPPAVKAPGKDA